MGAVEVRRRPTSPAGAGAAVRAWSGGGVDSRSSSAATTGPCTRRCGRSSSTAPSWRPASTRAGRRTCGSARSSTTTGSASSPARSPAPRSALGAAVGPAAAGPHVHGAGAARPGRRALAGHRRGRRGRRRLDLRAARPRATPRSSRPCSASPPPRTRVRIDTAPRTPAPRFPDDRSGVAILGCGTIAQSAHLPAYEQYGVGVTGVWSRTPATTADGAASGSRASAGSTPAPRSCWPIRRCAYVDIATGPEGRLEWIEAAVAAGKHVLAQKPLTLSADDLARLPPCSPRAEAAGVRVAVNHNGRWAPPWRAATLLVRDGAVGEVVGVTHLHDKPLPPLAGTPFDDVPTCCSPTTSCTGSTSPAPGWPTAAPAPVDRRCRRSTPGSRASRPRPATRGRPRCRWPPAPGPRATLRITGSDVATRARLPVLGARHRRAPCAAACCSTPTGSSSTTAPARTAVPLHRRVVRGRLRRGDGRADVRGGRGPASPRTPRPTRRRSVALVLAARRVRRAGGRPGVPARGGRCR